MKKTFLFILLVNLMFTSCQKQKVKKEIVYGQVKDIDGNSYETVPIGDQIWMKSNLNTSKFRNGDPIMQAQSLAEWMHAVDFDIPAWCYYDEDPSNGVSYGKYYNKWAVLDSRGLAPEGWHIPTKEEWNKLFNTYGDSLTNCRALKSTTGWYYNGNDALHFTAYPGGYRVQISSFDMVTYGATWWTSSLPTSGTIGSMHHVYMGNYCSIGTSSENAGFGCNVRCIKD